MASHDFRNFADLDCDSLDDFFAETTRRPGRKPDRKVTPSTLTQYAALLKTLYRQGQRYPVLAIPEPRAAMEFTTLRHEHGSTPLIPDEIAIHLLSNARRLIETPADDVIALYLTAQAASDAAARDGRDRSTSHANALAAISTFRFSTLPGEDRPWHPHPITSTARISYLVDRMMDAAFVLISFFVGMRAGEILGLQAGCVEPRPTNSPSDPPSIFLCGRILKTSRSSAGDPHRWTAPACAARAITVLEKLSEPLRARTGRSDLWLSVPGYGLHNTPSASAISVLSTKAIISRLNKEFAPFIELPLYQGKPWHLTTHQGRRKFASFVGRLDRTGLNALRDHFGHKSISMTDRAYVGNDPSLYDLIDENVRHETLTAFAELLTASEVGGPAGKKFAHYSEFRGRVMSPDVIDLAKWFLDDLKMRLGVCDWGLCLYRRATSACRGDDSGPNPVFRSQSTCPTCPNFAVTRRHLPVWQDRLARNLALLERPDLTSSTREEAQQRVDECRKIISSLNASPDSDDQESN